MSLSILAASAIIMLNQIPEGFEEDNSVAASAISTLPTTICTTDQFDLAKQHRNACLSTAGKTTKNFCSVIAFNRFCEPTTHSVANKYGSLAFRLGRTDLRYYNTFRFSRAKQKGFDDNAEKFMCTTDQKSILVSKYSACTNSKSSDECMTDYHNMKAILCETPKQNHSKSQQIITEVTSRTIEER